MGTTRYYALELNWEYEIMCVPEHTPDLSPTEHLKMIQAKVFPDREDNPDGVPFGKVSIQMLNHILKQKDSFFSVLKTNAFNVDLGPAIKYNVSFPQYAVLKTYNLQLPEGRFSGRAEMTAYKGDDLKYPLVTYESVFKGFRVEMTDRETANSYLKRNPHHLIYDILSSEASKKSLSQQPAGSKK